MVVSGYLASVGDVPGLSIWIDTQQSLNAYQVTLIFISSFYALVPIALAVHIMFFSVDTVLHDELWFISLICVV